MSERPHGLTNFAALWPIISCSFHQYQHGPHVGIPDCLPWAYTSVSLMRDARPGPNSEVKVRLSQVLSTQSGILHIPGPGSKEASMPKLQT